jgi:hypothetical protein
VVGFAIIALLCLGGGAAVFVFYDNATRVDLETPNVVTHEYIRAYLIDRDDAKAALYQCRGADLKDVQALRDDLDKRAKQYNITIDVSVQSSIEISRSGDHANVVAQIGLSSISGGTPLNRLEKWSFDLKNDGGWRVCNAHEVIQ